MSDYRSLISLCAALAVAAQTGALTPAYAFGGKSNKDQPKPAGTVLLPLSPKIDDGSTPAPPPAAMAPPAPDSAPAQAGDSAPAVTSRQNNASPRRLAGKPFPDATADDAATVQAPKQASSEAAEVPQAPARSTEGSGGGIATQPNISPESGNDDGAANDSGIDENTLLKGTVQIIADDTEYDQDKNTFLGTGNAVAIIAGQDSKLEADTILYDQNNGTIDARGNVKILRSGQLTTGSAFKFKVDSDEYLITNPDTELQGTTVVARTAKGNKNGLMFRNGTFTLPQPIHITQSAFYGPVSASEMVMMQKEHPDAYVPDKPSFTFRARKMVYERYKTDGNLTVFGGRLQFNHFSVPLGHFTANVGGENSRVVMPVTPLIGNNMMVGGTNIGPQFNYAVGKTGAFSWAPLIQFGGSNSLVGTASSSTTKQNGKLGAGFKIGYSTDRFSAHLGYGSVSNMLVGDLKYRFNKHTWFQSGINRFLNDGVFGMRRARLLAEVVDQRGITGIPYIGYLGFRTSAGWAEDAPGLTAQAGSNYAKLFNNKLTGKISAYRVSEQITATSHPIISIGDTKYGADMVLTAAAALRGYSTGDTMFMTQAGPMVNAHLNRARLRFGYTQSAVRGQSPFVFDQFIQGQRSVYFAGDVKLSRWLTLGTNLGYNMDAKLMYQRAVTAAVGGDDFKVIFIRDTISNYQRFGFNVLSGSPIPFDKLVVKGAPDSGRLGGI